MRKLLPFLLVLLLLIPAVSAQVPGGDGKCRDAAGGEIPCDSDGDGIPDDSDSCPNESGPVDNRGCPAAPVPAPATAVPPPPDQPQPDQPQPEQPQPQNPSTAPIEPTAVPPATVNLPLLNSTGNCVTATADALAVNLRTEPSTQAEVAGRLNPELVYRVYLTLETEEGLWYLLRGGWAASWVMRQGGDCDNQVMVTRHGGVYVAPGDLTDDGAAMLLPAVQKVREAAARMGMSSLVDFPLIWDVDPEGEWYFFQPPIETETAYFRLFRDTTPDPALMAFDPGFFGGVFITADPGDDTAAHDFLLTLDGIPGESKIYPLPTVDNPLPLGAQSSHLVADTDGLLILRANDPASSEGDTPLNTTELIFKIAPGHEPDPQEAIKGSPMTIVNNTGAVHEDGYEITLEDVIISSVVFNLPPRSNIGRLSVDPATGEFILIVEDVEGTETRGRLYEDQEGGTWFFADGDEEGIDTAKTAGWDVKANKAVFMPTIPPVDESTTDGIVEIDEDFVITISLLNEEATADDSHKEQIEILSWSFGESNAGLSLTKAGTGTLTLSSSN